MLRTTLILLCLMIFAAVTAHELTPTIKLAERDGKPDLEAILPTTFAQWHMDTEQPLTVINPVQEENIKRIYDQTLSRTYIGPSNYRVMLSIAYGADQRSGVALSVHYPEVCYPAQGFEVKSNTIGNINTVNQIIPVRRLETEHGRTRHEPVTYWIRLGEFLTLGGFDRRLIELRYGLKQEIPDGLLFRVSSIDGDSAKAFEMQEQFIKELFQNLPPEGRKRLAGKVQY